MAHSKPGDIDSQGLDFTLERKVTKPGGKRGYADAFKAGFFVWEYKTRGEDLEAAFTQLLQYSGDLGNPPLFVVSDMDKIEIRTHFTGFPTKAYKFDLATLTESKNLTLLRNVFHNFEALRPEKTIEKITEEAAKELAEIAPTIRLRHDDPTKVAHFLDRMVFCLFAEDAGLLPNRLFTRIIEKYATRDAAKISHDIGQLFKAMAHGGDVYGETIPHFNGNLFDASAPLTLNAFELEHIHKAAALDWSEMDPSIFGTLFERVMDPTQRAELGAHYTGYTDIKTLIEPVVMVPLRREWDACRARVESLLPDPMDLADAETVFPASSETARVEAKGHIDAFLVRLRSVRVLDPACGSGNFLYVVLRILKDLEYEVLVFSRRFDLPLISLEVGPHQLFGIEKNPYAHDLAQMTVWIGFLQWHRANGFHYERVPILQSLGTIENKDAILDLTMPEFPAEPVWPEADFIVGNPPFLGGKKMRTELGDEYVDRLFGVWRDRVKSEADLCCYWFVKAHRQIEDGRCRRAGLLATQGIRGGASRETLRKIKQTGDIYYAESDRNWVLDGATVHVSMIGFDDGSETVKALDGQPVETIHSNLTALTDVTQARRLADNLNIAFMGDTKGGKFDIIERIAVSFMDYPNPNGRPNSDVLIPWINGMDVTRRNRNVWIIDFGVGTDIHQASLYERPFEHARKINQKSRESSRSRIKAWWLHERPRVDMRRGINSLHRFIVTATVSKHRLFVWIEAPTLPDHQLIAFARADDFFFGMLHSRLHELWARSLGTQVRERESGFRYTPTSCFETFPFADPGHAEYDAIALAAQRLDNFRSNWLNPPEWNKTEILEFPGSVDGPWARYVTDPDSRGMGTVRYPRLIPRDANALDLAKRTLTNLYNARPSWLDLAHRELDEAVFAAYGWSPSMTDDEILAALLELNLERSANGEAPPAPADSEADSDGDDP
ncbi:MAG: hypothetical protein JWN86_447 [Planctomycetota bacterium]|nr:hypothetical protein [Planctomycetota bacterium]